MAQANVAVWRGGRGVWRKGVQCLCLCLCLRGGGEGLRPLRYTGDLDLDLRLERRGLRLRDLQQNTCQEYGIPDITSLQTVVLTNKKLQMLKGRTLQNH